MIVRKKRRTEGGLSPTKSNDPVEYSIDKSTSAELDQLIRGHSLPKLIETLFGVGRQ